MKSLSLGICALFLIGGITACGKEAAVSKEEATEAARIVFLREENKNGTEWIEEAATFSAEWCYRTNMSGVADAMRYEKEKLEARFREMLKSEGGDTSDPDIDANALGEVSAIHDSLIRISLAVMWFNAMGIVQKTTNERARYFYRTCAEHIADAIRGERKKD